MTIYCDQRFGDCQIAMRLHAGKAVPPGACPDGNVSA